MYFLKEQKPIMFYDIEKQCYAVRYNGETEYFNHNCDNIEHNERNAQACYKLLTNTIENIRKIIK